jgi:hypothetical protein
MLEILKKIFSRYRGYTASQRTWYGDHNEALQKKQNLKRLFKE